MADTEPDQDRTAEPVPEKEEGGVSEEEFRRSGSGASEPTED
jgi:hypothetical protein